MKQKLYLKIKFAWWLRYYIAALIFMCRLFRRIPDEAKLEKILELATIETKVTTEEPKSNFDA